MSIIVLGLGGQTGQRCGMYLCDSHLSPPMHCTGSMILHSCCRAEGKAVKHSDSLPASHVVGSISSLAVPTPGQQAESRPQLTPSPCSTPAACTYVPAWLDVRLSSAGPLHICSLSVAGQAQTLPIVVLQYSPSQLHSRHLAAAAEGAYGQQQPPASCSARAPTALQHACSLLNQRAGLAAQAGPELRACKPGSEGRAAWLRRRAPSCVLARHWQLAAAAERGASVSCCPYALLMLMLFHLAHW